MDLSIDITELPAAELVEYQQELTRTRLAINAKARDVQARLDQLAAERAEQRRLEDEQLGAVTKPPTQHLLGTPPELEA